MRINRTLLLPVIFVISIISFSFYAFNQIITRTTLGEAEVKKRVESLFNGEVKAVTKTNEQYKVTFSKDDFLYEVSVDEVAGTFSNIDLIKKGKVEKAEKDHVPSEEEKSAVEQKIEPEGEKTEKEQNNAEPEVEEIEEKPKKDEPEAVKPLTKQRVIQIARSKFNGEVDEIEFVWTNEGGYYNVDMENEEDEVILQIHALTGEILTITYDD